jgi:hypothetical protein
MNTKTQARDSFFLGYLMLFVSIILLLTLLFSIKRRTNATSSQSANDGFGEDSLSLLGDWKNIGADIQSNINKQILHARKS